MSVASPVKGAVRVYPLVQTKSDDVVAAGMQAMRRRGFEPIEDGSAIENFGEYTQVALWAIPPKREPLCSKDS